MLILISNWTEFTEKDKYTVSNKIIKQMTSIQLRYSIYDDIEFS